MPPASKATPKAKQPGRTAQGDHRVRVAKIRRERMRARLLKSVMVVYPEGTDSSPAVIDDVVRHADVSRGTFYKYFDSLNQAVEELGSQLASEMTEGSNELYYDLTDAPMRTATGFMTYLVRAFADHRWGAFLSHMGLLSGDNPMVRNIIEDIERGIATGDYSVASPSAASDVLIGAKVEAVRRIITGTEDLAYIQAVTTMVLRSFGMPKVKSIRTVEKAFAQIMKQGPERLDWWMPIDS